ncbi:RDD family protein [Mangrovibacterium diazotrophicum]|uniref:Putative RDD family membrane protein YckC n=1 Tax=Mangrovibacterium diazotrophicum TaxID=1261403 RepID=A0A419VU78_9BACT|nr:RDD family protein [Mangrovibacterium diazotrophicum]RKD85080.1 putative RDD family membrane protein YckC [Mangrovibacterium diazotrophicum]
MEEYNYPGVSLRVKAVVSDSIVLLILIIGATYLLESFNNVPGYVRGIVFVGMFLYDPILTSACGGTLGHLLFGIRVKRQNDQQRNIFFPLALIRYIVKIALGWISLVTVMSNKKGKAIHDMIVGSVVRYELPAPAKADL